MTSNLLLNQLGTAAIEIGVATASSQAILNAVKNILDAVYPVGTVYTSFTPTDPGTLFGGTWTKIENVFLLANGDVYGPGTSGGSPTVLLTVDQLPAHSHSFTAIAGATPDSTTYPVSGETVVQGAGTNASGITQALTGINGTTGEGLPVSILPPYETVYMWERTA